MLGLYSSSLTQENIQKKHIKHINKTSHVYPMISDKLCCSYLHDSLMTPWLPDSCAWPVPRIQGSREFIVEMHPEFPMPDFFGSRSPGPIFGMFQSPPQKKRPSKTWREIWRLAKDRVLTTWPRNFSKRRCRQSSSPDSLELCFDTASRWIFEALDYWETPRWAVWLQGSRNSDWHFICWICELMTWESIFKYKIISLLLFHAWSV